MEHSVREATRFPLNFTHATVQVTGTTPEGIVMVLEIGHLHFKEPSDAAILEIQPQVDIDALPERHLKSVPHPTRDMPSYMLHLEGTMVAPDGAEDPALFTVKVQQPEDLERMTTAEPTKEPVPSSWQDPECWS